MSTPTRPIAHTPYCTHIATAEVGERVVAGPPGCSLVSTSPIRRIVDSDATKPPTLTMPVAEPMRPGSFSVRA